MRARNDSVRQMFEIADALSRSGLQAAWDRGVRPYDYERSGGHRQNGAPSPEAVNGAQSANALPEPVARLPLDAWATDDGYVLVAYIPGVKPEQVNIVFEDGTLTLSGRFEPAAEQGEWLQRELFRGPFARRVTFRKPVNADAIEATYADGLLTLRVPMADIAKPKQIKVTPRAESQTVDAEPVAA